ncbi:LysR substrate-binding domain-containing protein [Streptomyces enissocaesilis]|uniref:Glyoxalase-like domain-containing protein n=1 Tax=Streptomyces enissocaesilis TaxID=332589 RepID=A0ABN3X6C7_9ACTN
MTSLNPVRHITFDAHAPYAIAEFWSHLTGCPLLDEPGDDEVLIHPERPGVPGLLFVRVPEGKAGKNGVHLGTQPPHGARDAEVERRGALGARIVDDRRTEDGRGWVVMAGPEGNEFCVERGAQEIRPVRHGGAAVRTVGRRARYAAAAATGPASEATPSTASAVPLTASTARAAPAVDLAPTHAYEPAPAVPLPSGVAAQPLLDEELVLVTAPGHAPATGSGRVALAELAGQPPISSAPSHPPRQGVEAAPAAAGATSAVVCESPGYALVCALVGSGLGGAVVPEMVAAMATTPVGVRSLEPAGLRRTISVAYRPGGASPAADTLRALLRGGFGRACTA